MSTLQVTSDSTIKKKNRSLLTMDTTDDQRSLPVIVTAHSPAGSPTVSRLGSPPRLLATDRPQYTPYLSALSVSVPLRHVFFVSRSLSFDISTLHCWLIGANDLHHSGFWVYPSTHRNHPARNASPMERSGEKGEKNGEASTAHKRNVEKSAS